MSYEFDRPASAVSQRPLRRRLFLAMSGLVVGTLLVATISFFFFNQHLEDLMLEIIMKEEMAVIQVHLDQNQASTLPRASSMRVFIGEQAPDQIRSLPRGRHHDVTLDGDRYDIFVDQWRDEPIYLLFNINQIEGLEEILFVMLGVMILLLTWLSAFVSIGMARYLAGPVDRLAGRVAKLQPAANDVQLAEEFRGDDVEGIARALDTYMQRIDGFVEREQAFTSAASHELRTPLAVIQGAAELISSGPIDQRQKNALERIERARRDMLEFIDALLSLSREELSTQDFKAESRVDEVLAHICRDMKELVEDSPVSIECGQPVRLLLNVPPSLLTIVISNLLRNAITHTREGVIRVRMEGRAVFIEDSGDGISDDIRERIFERHFSGRGGSGMGLYIVKRIADRYGWSITLEPGDMGGTRAILRF